MAELLRGEGWPKYALRIDLEIFYIYIGMGKIEGECGREEIVKERANVGRKRVVL